MVGASCRAHGEALPTCQESGAPVLGGTGSLAQGTAGAHSRTHGGASFFRKLGTPAWGGDGESSPGGGRSILLGLRGGITFQKTGHTGLGGTGSPAQGVVGVPFRACGEASSSKNRANRAGGGRGVQPRGWSGHLSKPAVGNHLS